ncbi:MAG: hypothetical protein ABGZ36_21935 [Actinomycetota bacterium]|uniref:hypothetical protein n=1 Tax=Euzebya rosea TaxID=2052804 RepID=UPI000D3E3B70|nr:hypothetical protein [Euzebya rosea]
MDAASITTIHGFCQRVLAAAGYAGDVGGRVELVENVDAMVDHHIRDLLVGFFRDTPIADKNEIPGEQTAYATLGIALANPVNVWDRGSVSTPVWQRVAVEGLS